MAFFFAQSQKPSGPDTRRAFPNRSDCANNTGNWTSVPYGDEWWTPGGQIVSFFHGTLQFDLFQQHNESRKLFPNLYYLLMAAVTGRWDVKDPMVLMFVMMCELVRRLRPDMRS